MKVRPGAHLWGPLDSALPALLAVLLAAAGAGCGNESGSAPAAGASPEASPGASERPPDPKPPASFLPGRRPPPPPEGLELLARIDPSADDYPVEVVALEGERLLRALAELVRAGSGAPASGSGIGPRTRFGALFAGAEPSFDDGFLRVQEPPADGAADLDWQALMSHAAEQGWALTLDPSRSRFAVVHVEGVPGDRPVLEAEVRLVGQGPAPRQRNARWRVELALEQGATSLLTVRALTQSEVSARAPLFRELTEAILSDLPRYEQTLLLGNDAYHERTDWRVDFFFLGMQGVALGDVDGDGLEDLYVCQMGGHPNLLLRRTRDGGVEDIAADAEVDFLDTTRGALLVDLDNDGAPDLALGRGSDIVVCWNDGKGRFPRRTLLRGPDHEPVYSLAAGDADGDGNLDLFAARYPHASEANAVPAPYHDARNGSSNLLWRNEGERRFKLASAELGFDPAERRLSYVAVWEDLDGDGRPDLYVANDFGPNNLYLNEDGRFVDRAAQSDAFDMAAGMGISIADVDLDGRFDLYVSNMHSPAGLRVMGSERFYRQGPPELRERLRRYAEGNTLLLNQGQGRFVAGPRETSAAIGGWAWGALFLDLQNDGAPDLYVPNGFISGPLGIDVESLFWRRVVDYSPAGTEASEPYRAGWRGVGSLSQQQDYSWNGHERNHLYLNAGEGRFVDASAVTDTDFLDDGRLVVRMDWDGDGRLDLVLRNRTGPRLRILQNVHPATGRFLVLELTGTRSNRDAIGARVEVRAGGRTLVHAVRAGEGLLAQSSKRIHVGLGAAREVEGVRVRWPSGLVEELGPLEPDGWYRVLEGEGRAQPLEVPRAGPLEELSARPVPPTPFERTGRVPLMDSIPLGALRLPGPDGKLQALARFAGDPLLVLIFDPRSTLDAEVLGAIGRDWPALERMGLSLLPLARGAGGAQRLEAAGLPVAHGIASPREVNLIQAVLIEVLGPFGDLPLPLGLLLHPGGELVSLMMGPSGYDELLRDVGRVRYMDPEGRSTTRLTGGRWLQEPRRSFDDLARVMQMLGERDLAQSLLEARRAR